jgi:hypothetical protein
MLFVYVPVWKLGVIVHVFGYGARYKKVVFEPILADCGSVGLLWMKKWPANLGTIPV